MKRAIKIAVSGEITEIDLDTDNTLALLQGAVGGYIEPVDLSRSLTMFVNEEGKLTGLEHNPFGQFAFDATFGVGLDVIVGDVVFTGGTDHEGETMGLTSMTQALVRSLVSGEYRILPE